MNQKRDETSTDALATESNGTSTERTPETSVDADMATETEASRVGDTTIRETPGVCGGYPCVGHTRVSVRNVVVVYRETGNDFERTADVFDMLTREQVQAALDYYAAHPARVDEDIERNARAWAEITGRAWSG